MSQRQHLGAVACAVHGDGLGEVRCRSFQRLPRVGSHQLAQLARLAESNGAQIVLDALSLRASS